MTPEEIEQLARKCASAVAKVEGPSSYYERMLPILTVHLAAREEECARLREAAELATKQLENLLIYNCYLRHDMKYNHTPFEDHYLTWQEHDEPFHEAAASLRKELAALTPQQEQGNVQLPDMP